MKDPILRDAGDGDPYACLGVAYMYHYGKGLDQDLDQAVVWYLRAAELGCTRAEWEIAKMYRDGIIFNQDIYEYLRHLRNASEMGNPEAQYTLAIEYIKGILVSPDQNEAFKWMSTSAKQGVPMAQFYLGYMYGHGVGTERSRTEAELWYSSTAITGNADMFMDIGLWYEFGLNGIVHNEIEAKRWYRYGAEMGHAGCLLCLNSVILGLQGEKKDTFDIRMKKLKETDAAIERDTRDSAYVLANRYLDEGDYKNSFIHFEKAAELGSPDAMFFLSLMYREGMYVRRNMQKSLSLLARAADAGSADAQFMLGRLYDVGGGLAESEVDAIKYYTMAAAGGYLAALYYLGMFVEHPELHVRRSVGRYR
ncbi:MAG: tetratricopeptide repeat protein [Candidatus Methanomethylophilaceae archaeon]